MGVTIVFVLISILVSLPAYVIGRKCRVNDAWVAFIPLAGPTVVLLWSIKRTGWMAILGLVPLVNIVFAIWLAFAVPSTQRRSLAWGLALLLVPVIGMYAYAFTLAPSEPYGTGWVA